MSEQYARDPVILDPGDGFANAGRVGGFVPKTIFYDEPSANKAVTNEVAFFQDFGIPDPKQIFWSIDEHPYLEATMADMAVVVEDQRGQRTVVFIGLKPGFVTPRPVEPVESAWVPTWPPMLRLVRDEPEWRSVDWDEDRVAREERKRLEDYDRKIMAKCPRCAFQKNLVLWEKPKSPYLFAHGLRWSEDLPLCEAADLHKKRGTVVEYLFAPEEKEREVS